jgi:hypothetical protein
MMSLTSVLRNPGGVGVQVDMVFLVGGRVLLLLVCLRLDAVEIQLSDLRKRALFLCWFCPMILVLFELGGRKL